MSSEQPADEDEHPRAIENADCPGCDHGVVIEAPEAGYALCSHCGERGYRRGDTVEWWRHDPESQWYMGEETA